MGLAIRIGITLLIACTSITALAANKVRVRVTFHLSHPTWQEPYKKELAALQAAVAESIADQFAKRIWIVEFTAHGNAPYVLNFELNDRDREDKANEMGFHISLSPSTADAIYWRFRPAVEFHAKFTPSAALVDEIERYFQNTPDKSYRDLIKDLLRYVPIARDSMPYKRPPGWVLPHKGDDLCMAFRTTFRVDSMLPMEGQSVNHSLEAEYQAKFAPPPNDARMKGQKDHILALMSRDQRGFEIFDRAEVKDIRVQGVYVLNYIPEIACLRPTPPEEAFKSNDRQK